jgi:hypothetical protein
MNQMPCGSRGSVFASPLEGGRMPARALKQNKLHDQIAELLIELILAGDFPLETGCRPSATLRIS